MWYAFKFTPSHMQRWGSGDRARHSADSKDTECPQCASQRTFCEQGLKKQEHLVAGSEWELEFWEEGGSQMSKTSKRARSRGCCGEKDLTYSRRRARPSCF